MPPGLIALLGVATMDAAGAPSPGKSVHAVHESFAPRRESCTTCTLSEEAHPLRPHRAISRKPRISVRYHASLVFSVPGGQSGLPPLSNVARRCDRSGMNANL